MKLDFSLYILEKYSNIKFHKFRPIGAGLFHAEGQIDGQTDRHGEANARIPQFCERV
jgi:hypothetical protein